MKLSRVVLAAAVSTLFLLLLVGCSSLGIVPATPTPTSTSTPSPSPTPTTTPTPTNTPTPTVTPTPTPLSPAALFDRFSPSLAFIKTPYGRGTGLLLHDGYILTNAHVVLPNETVDVTFPDKSEFKKVKVYNVDMLADLAILGPIATEASGVTLTPRENLDIGSEVYLLGYPGEVENFPKPTISKGLISRYREWDALGISFFQTDAAVSGGQSGGILVTPRGEIIGISSYAFADRSYALVASSKDILPRIKQMLAGKSPNDVKWVPPSNLTGSLSATVELPNRWEDKGYLIFPGATGDKIDLKFTGSAMARMQYTIVNSQDFLIREGSIGSSKTEEEITVKEPGPYYLIFSSNPHRSMGSISVKSDKSLYECPENEKYPLIKVGSTTYGALDFPGDIDTFRIVLHKGDEVNIQVSSLLIDPYLIVDLLDKPFPREALIEDDNTGGGVLGRDAELTFRAPKLGTYLIVVTDLADSVGGYVVKVQKPYEGAPTPVSPPPTPTPIVSKVGPMRLYRSTDAPFFSIQYPAKWSREADFDGLERLCNKDTGIEVCAEQEPDGLVTLMIDEENLATAGIGHITLKDYTDLTERVAQQKGFQVVNKRELTTSQGLKPVELEMTFGNGAIRIWKLMYVEGDKAFNAGFVLSTPSEEDMNGALKRKIDKIIHKTIPYVFSTFKVEQSK